MCELTQGGVYILFVYCIDLPARFSDSSLSQAPEWYWAEPFCIGSTESILKIIFEFYFFYSVFTLFKSLEQLNQGKCFLSHLGSEIIVHLSELLRDGATPLGTGCIVSILPGRTLGEKNCAPLVWHIHQPEAVR